MADDHALASHASGMDYPEHERTYRMFVSLAKWGTVSIAVLLVLMAYFLI